MNPTEQFHQLSEEYIRALFEFSPQLGSWAGLHEYDQFVPDLGETNIKNRAAMVRAQLQTLAQVERGALSADDQFDARLLQSALEAELYRWEDEQEWRRNPMWYSNALDLITFIKRAYAPLPERMDAVIRYLRAAPEVYRCAQANLVENPPRPMVEMSLEVFEGLIAFFEVDLVQAAQGIQDLPQRDALESARRLALSETRAYLQYLREVVMPRASADFAIGQEKFERMLRSGELVDLPLDKVLEVGERDLARNLAAVHEAARRIDPRLTPGEAMDLVKREHPPKEELIPKTRAMLEEIRQYLIDHDIITVPSEVRAQVEATPAFLRWAFAFMDTPGPFERVATEAYYYVTPPENSWLPEKQEEWLTAFNSALLKNMSVHEAYPGHYVHFLHVNHRTRGKLRQLIYSYAFSEGWAHYAEEMMLAENFGDGDPKLRLAQLSDALLRDSRYVCSIKMHAHGMTVDEATRFFVENAFMEETPAHKEALRGTFDPGYLNYTLGKLMILKLREDVKRRDGAKFSLKQFHDDLLALGAPPVPLAREVLYGEDGEIL